MLQTDCTKYLDLLEKKVIIPAFVNGVFGEKKDMIVPLQGDKLLNTPFGEFIGRSFEWFGLLSINFYGFYKLSSGVITASKSVENIFGKVRTIKSPVVYFNSVKIEYVKELAPEMYSEFSDFKKLVVKMRWDKSKKV